MRNHTISLILKIMLIISPNTRRCMWNFKTLCKKYRIWKKNFNKKKFDFLAFVTPWERGTLLYRCNKKTKFEMKMKTPVKITLFLRILDTISIIQNTLLVSICFTKVLIMESYFRGVRIFWNAVYCLWAEK